MAVGKASQSAQGILADRYDGLVAFQVRAIIASPFPGLQAIESLAASVRLFLALFASTYFVMASSLREASPPR